MTKKKSNKLKWRVIIACVVLIPLVVLAGAALWFSTAYDGQEKRIYIPANSSVDQIADTLRMQLGSAFANKVMLLWKLQKSNPKAARGSYLVKPGTSPLKLSRTLRYGHQTPVRFTFNNIRTLPQLALRASECMEFSDSDFLAACDSVLPPMGFKPEGFPTAFMPDTYEFYWTDSAPTMVKKLAKYRNDFWTQERRDKAKAMGLTPVQVATLASIVEEETNMSDERPRVARLYLNRLDRGMKLQADPTVKFAVGDFSLRRILGKHLATESAYNTYLHEGLPPGPIRIPTKATLEAVLSAPKHDYLYMCAKEDFSGYHNFATDFATHQANARRYQKALTDRGIK